jgi:hypothetical protein
MDTGWRTTDLTRDRLKGSTPEVGIGELLMSSH